MPVKLPCPEMWRLYREVVLGIKRQDAEQRRRARLMRKEGVDIVSDCGIIGMLYTHDPNGQGNKP